MMDIFSEIMPVIFIFEIFFFGLMVGYEAAKQNNPNEPKPKNWEEKLIKRYIKGFEDGEKSMLKRISKKVSEECYWN